MHITIKDTHESKDFLVRVTAVVDGKDKPKATASLTGFGGSLHRDLVFDLAKLKQAEQVLTDAQPVVERVQALADELHQRGQE